MKKLLPLIFVFFWFASAASGQGADAPKTVGIEQLYLAKDDGTGKAGDPSSEFFTTDIPIFCVVVLDSNQPVSVKMNLVVVNVPGVRSETKVVSTRYLTKNNEDRVNFSGNPHGLWTAGKYRVEIYIDDKLARKQEFDIRGSKTPINNSAGFQPRTSVKPRPSRKPKKTQFARN